MSPCLSRESLDLLLLLLARSLVCGPSPTSRLHVSTPCSATAAATGQSLAAMTCKPRKNTHTVTPTHAHMHTRAHALHRSSTWNTEGNQTMLTPFMMAQLHLHKIISSSAFTHSGKLDACASVPCSNDKYQICGKAQQHIEAGNQPSKLPAKILLSAVQLNRFCFGRGASYKYVLMCFANGNPKVASACYRPHHAGVWPARCQSVEQLYLALQSS